MLILLREKVGKYFFTLQILLLLGSFDSFSSLKPPEKPVIHLKTNTHSLAETVNRGLTSLRFESVKERGLLIDHARFYARLRHGLVSRKLKGKFDRDCAGHPELNPFCGISRDFDRKNEEASQSSATQNRTVKPIAYSQKDINSWLAQGRVKPLAVTQERSIREALKEFSSYSSLEKVASELISSSSCNTASLSQMVGAKLEEFLPDSSVRKKAIELYETILPCGESEKGLRARFRISLLHIWEGQCKSALPYLTELVEHTPNDYRSRALFWQIECRKQLGDLQSASQARQTLLEKYPFSLHTLLAQSQGSNQTQKLPIELKPDSDLRFRLNHNEALNGRIRAVEALLNIRELTLAKEILERAYYRLELADPQFRLYAAVLFNRMNCYIRNFRLLASVFRDDPTLISRSAMELFYPEHVLSPYDLSRSEIDQKLLLSLIRQESAFNSRARSPAGAMGLMQIMPGTARLFGRLKQTEKLLDPSFNLKIGSLYFSTLLKRYDEDAELALAAYNAGPRRVDDWLRRYPVRNRMLFLDLIPFKETREYVAAIARNYFWYVALYPDPQLKSRDLRLSGKETQGKVAHRSFSKVFRPSGT